MKRTAVALAILAYLALLLAGCGGSAPPPPPPGAPSVPTNLASEGSKGAIDLTWTASTGEGLTGYNVYRSEDGGTNFVSIATVTAPATAYQDTVVSDGALYQYRVTAVGDAESGPSNVTVNIHGTRLSGTMAGPFSAAPADSPYVVDVGETLTVTGGALTVPDGAKLYMLGGATVELNFGYQFIVNGLLKVLASSANPAAITAHSPASPTANGFSFNFAGADAGTTIQNTTVDNLRNSSCMEISGCNPIFYNAKFSSNESSGGSYIEIYGGSAPDIQHCRFTHLVPHISNDLSGNAAFIMEHNIFTGGFYPIYFSGIDGPAVMAGAIRYNDFECYISSNGQIYLSQMTGSNPVPLENNYWTGGTGTPPLPAVYWGFGTTNTVDYDPPLAASPATTAVGGGLAGPDW